jgi:hypothetical protein
VAALALTLVISAVALAGAAGAGPLASDLHGLFGTDAPSTPAALPAGATELQNQLGVAESHGGHTLIPAATANT